MTKLDLENIRFLLSRTPKQLREWYDTVSVHELVYASHIMDIYADYLNTEILFNKIEQDINDMPVLLDAQAVIASVRA